MAGTPIIPASPSPIPSATTGPADGDLANAASVNGAFLDLMSGVVGNRIAAYGRVCNVHCRSVNGTVIAVDALGSVILTTGGGANWISFLNSTSQTVTAATALGAALGNNTRYYLYAYNNAGTLDFIANTNVPNASRTYENGNTDRVFITTFITDGSGIIIPYVQENRRVVYTTPGQNPSMAMNTGGAAWTDVNPNATTPMVPLWAQTISLYTVLVNSDSTAGGDAFSLRAKSVTATGYTGAAKVFIVGAVDHYTQYAAETTTLVLSDSQIFQYQWATGGAGRAAVGYIEGWSY